MNKWFVMSFVVGMVLSATLIAALTPGGGGFGGGGPALGGENYNKEISIQGRLMDSAGKPLTGQYQVKFEIFTAATGGTSLWSDVQTLSIDKGLFQTILGSTTLGKKGFNFSAMKFNAPYFVEITVGADNPLTPRYALTANPYAFSATTVDDKAITSKKMAITFSSENLVAGQTCADTCTGAGKTCAFWEDVTGISAGKPQNQVIEPCWSAPGAGSKGACWCY